MRPRRRGGGRQITLPGSPGPARLRWEGEGVLPGKLEEITLPERGLKEVSVVLRPDPDSRPLVENLELRLEGEVERDEEILVHGRLEDENLEEMFEVGGDTVLDRTWRQADRLIVRVGGLISDALVPPERGPLEVPLRPGGYLVVVPEAVIREEMGDLVIRRADGLPFLVSEYVDESAELVVEAIATVGMLVGPLPEGECVFEARLGRARLRDARVRVRGGGIGVLRIGK
jgi:hypothetical protein